MTKRSLLFVLLGAFLLASCSADGAKIASYKINNEMKYVTVKDFKAMTPAYLNNNPQWIADTLRHEIMVYESLIRPELVYNEIMTTGMTNDPEFSEKLDAINKQTPLIMLNTYGRNSLTNVSKAGFETARASHILISFNEYTNINGKKEKIADEEFARILESKMLKAQNILDKLKKAKNLAKEFELEAKMSSDDPGSKVKGGDLDIFFPGQMVPEFDAAVFGAKKTGLVDELVKTQFGYHIIYVTEVPKKRTIKEISKGMDKQRAAYLARSLVQKNMTDQQKEAVELKYELNISNKTVKVGDQVYTVSQIPQDLVLLKINGNDYTWKTSDQIIETFVPSFVTNKSFDDFSRNMGILQNFMFFVEVAKAKKLDQTAAYKKEIKERNEQLLKDTATEMWMNELRKEAENELTEAAIKDYYATQKARFTKQENTPKGPKQVQMSYAEAKPQIENELSRNLFMEAQQNKDELLKQKYSVTIIKEGLAKYSEGLKKNYEAAKKKQEKKKAPPAPQQPQGAPQPNIKPQK